MDGPLKARPSFLSSGTIKNCTSTIKPRLPLTPFEVPPVHFSPFSSATEQDTLGAFSWGSSTMFENRDNDPHSSANEGSPLPERPFQTFTPQQCIEEVVAQLAIQEITAAARSSIRCCVDSLPPRSCDASDVLGLVSALRPLTTSPIDADGHNTLEYCMRSVLSTYFATDVSSPERLDGKQLGALAAELGRHTRLTQDPWIADIILHTLLASDLPLSPREASNVYRQLTYRELLYLKGQDEDPRLSVNSFRANKHALDIGEIIFEVVAPLEKEITLLPPASMNSSYSYVSCWLKHLTDLEPSRMPSLAAFDNDHTRYLIRESFRFFYSQMLPAQHDERVHHSYVVALVKFFTSHIAGLQPQPQSWFIPASEAYCLLLSLTLSKDILSSSEALRKLATSPLLDPDSLLTPVSYTVHHPYWREDIFTISSSHLIARNRAQRTLPVREVTIIDGSISQTMWFWRDERLASPSDMRVAIDYRTPDSKICLRGLTIQGVQSYISDGPLCLPTDPTTPEHTRDSEKRSSIIKNGDALVPITPAQLRGILRLVFKGAAYLHRDYLVSLNQLSLEA